MGLQKPCNRDVYKRIFNSTVTLLLSLPVGYVNAAPPPEDAESFISRPSEFELERFNPKVELEMLTSNLAGENVSIKDGGISFSVTDVSVPTNTSIPVNITRTYERFAGKNDFSSGAFGDWDLSIPKIESTAVRGNNGGSFSRNYNSATVCSQVQSPGSRLAYGRIIEQSEYWNGADLNIPGVASGKLTNVAGNARYKVQGNIKVSCGSQNNNEYFIAKTPNGVTYTFDVRQTYPIKSLAKGSSRYRVVYYASKVEDRFGNEVRYVYDSSINLKEIKYSKSGSSSFEKLIDITYSNAKISSISATGKTWNYRYADRNLEKVILPNDKFWKYTFPSYYNFTPEIKITYPRPPNSDPGHNYSMRRNCEYYSSTGKNTEDISIKHPEGAVASFKVKLTVHGKTEVPARYMQFAFSSNQLELNINACYANFSLIQKKLNIDGNTSVWAYEYLNEIGHWNIDGWNKIGLNNSVIPYTRLIGYSGNFGSDRSCNANIGCQSIPTDLGYHPIDLRLVKITNPDGTYIHNYVSKKWDFTEGKVVAKQFFSSSSQLIRTEKYTFKTNRYIGEIGLNDPAYSTNEQTMTYEVVQLNTTVIENGDEYIVDYNEYNQYGSLVKQKHSNNFNNLQRFIKTDYQHNTSKWVLNLPTKHYLSSSSIFGTPYKETTYHSSSFLPYQQKVMGRVATTNIYHADGNLKKTTYNGSNRYEQFEDYYRGKARKITMPCPVAHTCGTENNSTANTIIAELKVNSDGTTKSVTDFKGNTTTYGYNPIGWLASVDYTDKKWTDKSINYHTVTSSGDGISGRGVLPGMLKQTITQGNYEKRTYHDSLLRPVFTRERDKSKNETIRYQRTRYDYDNRPVYQSFPSNSASASIGTETNYDALGRITSSKRQSDNARTSIDYLSGNRKQITDAKGNITTTTYQAYGSPSYSKPTLIDAPDTSDTVISYNLYDQVSSISQGNFTENRIYDSYQQLCKVVRPETGITAMGYNSQRQPVWRALGTNGSTTSCDASAVPSSHKVIIGYDNLGQVRTENFPGGTPDKTYSYDANGNLKRLQAGSVIWNYDYNTQNGLEKETLSLDGKNFVLDWNYNSLGAVSSLIYPSGLNVSYSPNALGQPTKAGSYATNVKYHPNGQTKSFTYGNGITRSVELDTTGRIDLINDTKSSSIRVKLDPSYDRNDNLSGLIDYHDRRYDIGNLSYDGVDRLKTANGKWGSGSYGYDGLGNITSRSFNGSTIGYQYDTKNRLKRLTGAYAYSYGYDAMGNITHNGRFGLTFNRANQMTNANGGTYTYDGHNRRVKKTKAGNHYSVYSSGGQILHRLAADGKKTDSIYLGKQIVAEVDNGGSSTPPPPPEPEPTPAPTINLSVTTKYSSGTCKFGACITPIKPPVYSTSRALPLPPRDASHHEVYWTSANATSCSGVVKKFKYANYVGQESLSGTSSGFNTKQYPADGTLYEVSLTCTGAGGSLTKTGSVTTSTGNEY